MTNKKSSAEMVSDRMQKVREGNAKRKWLEGLSWSRSELKAITQGRGSEAYDHTYGEYPIPKVYRQGAKKDLKKLS